MSNESLILSSYFITLWLIGLTSMVTMRFGLTPDKPKYKKATLFFSLGLGLPAIIGSPLLTVSFENEWIEAIKGTIAATSYLISAHCFKYGFAYRSGRNITNPYVVLLHVVLFAMAIMAFSTNHLIASSPFIRLCLIVSNIVFITVLTMMTVKKDQRKPATFGERVTFVVIFYCILTYCCYPFLMIFSQSKFQYLSFSLPLQVLQLHLWIISLLVLILSDTINIFRQQATTDAMTGLNNRRHFFKCANEMIEEGNAASLIVCDIDEFKLINDSYGHSGGDQVIIGFSELLKSVRLQGAIAARIGGEEFAIFLPHVSLAQAKKIADNLRSQTERLEVEVEKSVIRFTSSFGVASICKAPKQNAESAVEAALKEADAALYQAKSAGRNVVMTQQVPAVS